MEVNTRITSKRSLSSIKDHTPPVTLHFLFNHSLPARTSEHAFTNACLSRWTHSFCLTLWAINAADFIFSTVFSCYTQEQVLQLWGNLSPKNRTRSFQNNKAALQISGQTLRLHNTPLSSSLSQGQVWFCCLLIDWQKCPTRWYLTARQEEPLHFRGEEGSFFKWYTSLVSWTIKVKCPLEKKWIFTVFQTEI